MRVVSLVPSLTEAVALTRPEVLVGATDWCTHPGGLDVARVGGSKYPDLARVLALRPDLVLLNEEENRRADADALLAAGVPVRVTFPRTVPEALTELAELAGTLGATTEPDWLVAARRAWAALPEPGALRRAVVPVWRRPWVVLGSGTFAGDVLRRLGVANLYAEHAERYPRPDLAELRARRPELVVLPDEPYRFTADDGPESFPGVPCALVSGRHLTWYGPSLAEAPALLAAQLAHPG
ncbi:helical backbone metal receptor [Micromonospora inositola]|uniref:ABC-type Fe3+-hydroxamate transport system, substrate-binding protein n=1 Tax=Micromonospora inositola TaxID=47865 RepID=A0A1C5JBM3_9ACTN|nr:helical backbone metal receptor [Micromonospora inositola]SCG67965.1 ABC-type Fe3+-hydroxamate transport system, substrate-binding protein [Micromonospora inositola]